MQKLRPLRTALRTIIHFDLQECHCQLLRLLQRRAPRFKRIDDEITSLVGAAKGDVELTALFVHDTTGSVRFLQAQVMIARAVIC